MFIKSRRNALDLFQRAHSITRNRAFRSSASSGDHVARLLLKLGGNFSGKHEAEAIVLTRIAKSLVNLT
jgi:hypothetical protein